MIPAMPSKILSLSFVLVFYVLISSCAGMGRNPYPKHSMTSFDNMPVDQTRAYKEYKSLVPGDKARISYLLWRMEYSNLKFWRNGSTYTGRDGAAWLRWKMRKFYPDVKDPAEFVSRVASHSEKTLIPYRVSCAPYGDFHDLEGVLAAELKTLNEFEMAEAPQALPTASPTAEESGGKSEVKTVEAVAPAVPNPSPALSPMPSPENNSLHQAVEADKESTV